MMVNNNYDFRWFEQCANAMFKKWYMKQSTELATLNHKVNQSINRLMPWSDDDLSKKNEISLKDSSNAANFELIINLISVAAAVHLLIAYHYRTTLLFLCSKNVRGNGWNVKIIKKNIMRFPSCFDKLIYYWFCLNINESVLKTNLFRKSKIKIQAIDLSIRINK